MADANFSATEKTASDANSKKEDNALPRVRTFRGDIEQYMEKGQPSLISIVAERLEKESGTAKETYPNRRQIIIFGVIGLIISGLAVAVFFIFFPKNPPREIILRPPQSLIPAEEEKVIEIKEGDRASIILSVQELLASRHPRKSLLSIAALQKKASGEKVFLEAQNFFRSLEIQLPPETPRALKGQFLLGIFSGANQLSLKNNNLVFIFKITSYEQAFAGMLGWEESIVRDLAALMPRHLNIDTGNEVFRDAVIRNQDVRYIVNKEKEPVLFYTIFNRQILIITTSQEALEEIINRLTLSFPR